MFRWLQREPKQLVERRQALSAPLLDYPLYEPPHRQGPNFLRRRQNQTEEEYVSHIHEFVARSDQNFRRAAGISGQVRGERQPRRCGACERVGMASR
jgi:hypothetical protein